MAHPDRCHIALPSLLELRWGGGSVDVIMNKPVGYSLFAREVLPVTIGWAKTRLNWSGRRGMIR